MTNWPTGSASRLFLRRQIALAKRRHRKRLRRFLPRKINLDTFDQASILAAAHQYNHTPRKCLDFKTPAEAFSQCQSHVALQT
ncbi:MULTISPECIES: hypothetical protein [Sphingobium]|uniref:Transposase n=1 Tax=Sphingobium yanoikuyae TaxID=13690 RepID=A0A9X7U9S7_SPHYA|nr:MULTISPECIES: hypothetical protein [Sphingobium]MDV3478783.1 hypothetical protein [Sphingobium yanoikuyae]QNG46438.1 hypothetical protein H3V42_01840 [Sphingobium yanoikuyae]